MFLHPWVCNRRVNFQYYNKFTSACTIESQLQRVIFIFAILPNFSALTFQTRQSLLLEQKLQEIWFTSNSSTLISLGALFFLNWHNCFFLIIFSKFSNFRNVDIQDLGLEKFGVEIASLINLERLNLNFSQ